MTGRMILHLSPGLAYLPAALWLLWPHVALGFTFVPRVGALGRLSHMFLFRLVSHLSPLSPVFWLLAA